MVAQQNDKIVVEPETAAAARERLAKAEAMYEGTMRDLRALHTSLEDDFLGVMMHLRARSELESSARVHYEGVLYAAQDKEAEAFAQMPDSTQHRQAQITTRMASADLDRFNKGDNLVGATATEARLLQETINTVQEDIDRADNQFKTVIDGMRRAVEEAQRAEEV